MSCMIAAATLTGPPVGLIFGLIVSAAIIVNLLSFFKRYKRCPANKVLVVTGKTSTGDPEFIRSGAVFVWPLIQQYDYLDLRPVAFSVGLGDASAEATIAVSQDPQGLRRAAARLLGLDQEEVAKHARSVVAARLADVAPAARGGGDRAALLEMAQDAAREGLADLGLELVALTFSSAMEEGKR